MVLGNDQIDIRTKLNKKILVPKWKIEQILG